MICPNCGINKENIMMLLSQRTELKVALQQLLDAAMPIRADNATLQDIVKATPALYDACHSAAILLNLLDCRKVR